MKSKKTFKPNWLVAMLLLLSSLPFKAFAYDFMVDGIAYNFNDDGTSVSVTYTEMWSENNYSGLTTADIPPSVIYDGNTYDVTSISDRAFQYCSTLASITIPNTVTYVGRDSFGYCNGLTRVNINDLVAWCNILFIDNPLFYAHHLYLNGIEIKDLVIPNSITSIGENAFTGGGGFTSVSIPNSVTSIGFSAFRDCTGLTRVVIPSSVTTIGTIAFYNCNGLTNIIIPNSVTSIGEEAFWNCSSLTSISSLIEYPSSVTLGSGVFTGVDLQNCTLYVPAGKTQEYKSSNQWGDFYNIMEIIPFADSEVERICVEQWDVNGDGFLSYDEADLVTTIGGFSSSNITSFNELEYFHNATAISDYAFYDCNGLTGITIPNSITSIGYAAFEYCSGLKSITIPNSVTYVGRDSFGSCTGLTRVNINDLVAWCNILFIDNPLFYAHHLYLNGIEIKDLVIPNSITSIGENAFTGGGGFTSVSIPNSVTSIGFSAFRDCTGLTRVVIPNSVTTIGTIAFYNCNGLTNITIPNSITKIETNAFYGCSSLARIEAYPDPTKVTLGNEVFDGVPKVNVLHVLPRYLSAYSTADQWKDFSGIEDDLSTSRGDVNYDGAVDVLDVTTLINMILGIIPTDTFSGDLNDSGSVDVLDVTMLINIILGIH